MAVIRSDFYHCWLVRQPVSSLPSHDITIVIYAMVVSKLDYWNLPYKGLPLNLIWKLQLVQNAAAYLLTGTFPKARIQPVLCQVHQLPVEYQIKVKIMMLTFKALCYLRQHIGRTVSPTMSPKELCTHQTNISW